MSQQHPGFIKSKVTQADLRDAKKAGVWILRNDSMFYLNRRENDDLKRPGMVIKAWTPVHVEKVSRRGRAALLCYIDRSGKVWWSWTHATELEPPRQRSAPL